MSEGNPSLVSLDDPKDPPLYRAHFLRAWQRLNAVLIYEEQMTMIQLARQRFHAGETEVRKYASFTAPGSIWNISIDAAAGTMNAQLSPCPEWVLNKSIVGEPGDFYLLPMDGSKSWQFAAKPATN